MSEFHTLGYFMDDIIVQLPSNHIILSSLVNL